MMRDPSFAEPEAGARAGRAALELLDLIGRGEAGEAPAEALLDWLRARVDVPSRPGGEP